MSGLKAGFARTEINPMLGIGISGYFVPRYAETILDNLEANAVALSNNGKTVLLIALDALELKIFTVSDIKEKIAERMGLDKDAMFISCTHTHTSPYTGYVEQGAPKDLTDKYTEEFVVKVADVAAKAVADLKDAKMGYGKCLLPGVAFVRRYLMKDGTTGTNPGVYNPNIVKPLGTVDEEVEMIRIDRKDDSLVLVGFGCHPDTIGGNNVSADWPGFFRRTFEKAVDNTKAVFFNGALGDINHIKVGPTGGDMNDLHIDFDDVPRGYSQARYMGRAVAGAALKIFDKVAYTDDDAIDYAIRIVDLPTNMPTKEEAIEAHRVNDLHAAGKDSELPYEGMMLTTVLGEAERMVNLENGPEYIQMPLSAVKIGKVAFIGIAGEPFNQIGVQLKKAEGWDCVVPCCVTNGYVGYFPMKDSYDEGGYEARSSYYKAGVAELIVKNGVELLNGLR